MGPHLAHRCTASSASDAAERRIAVRQPSIQPEAIFAAIRRQKSDAVSRGLSPAELPWPADDLMPKNTARIPQGNDNMIAMIVER
jgi:hypothetical protein